MRKIRIPQKPDRPDIDDLIFGDEHETQSGCRSSRVVFLYLFPGNQKQGSSILNMKKRLKKI